MIHGGEINLNLNLNKQIIVGKKYYTEVDLIQSLYHLNHICQSNLLTPWGTVLLVKPRKWPGKWLFNSTFSGANYIVLTDRMSSD
jgi:hypothetical protein